MNLFLKYTWMFHLSIVSLGIYLGIFCFVVGALLLVQTKNLLLGRTTFERFSNLSNMAYSDSHGESVSKKIDSLHIMNCVFMCLRCELADQNKLEEFLTKTRLKSSESMFSGSTISAVNLNSYHKNVSEDEQIGLIEHSGLSEE